jgi:parvulin-like peptidyl-prolyl isomerase
LAKKRVDKPQRELTKRQHTKWQEEKRRSRIILGAATLAIVAVLVVIGTGFYNGWYKTEYKPLHETVLEVNGTKFNMDRYIKRLQFYGANMSTSAYTSAWADTITQNIERYTLMVQEAEKMGYTASDDDVKLYLTQSNTLKKEYWDEYWDVARADVVSNYLMGDFFDKQVPTTAAQKQVLAMFLDSAAQVSDVKARLAAGEDFGTVAAELSMEGNTREKKGDLGWVPQGVLTQELDSTAVDDFIFNARIGDISEAIPDTNVQKNSGYWIIKVLEKNNEGAPHVHPILVGTREEAEAVKARIAAGEDFDTVQSEVTQDQDNRCLYWLEEGKMSDAFDQYVFDPNTQLEAVSDPIRDDSVITAGGYWLVKVVGEESNKEIDDNNRGIMKSAALSKWLDGLIADPDNKIVSYLDDEKKNWALGVLMYGL